MIEKIIPIEWDLFSGLNNIGGKASCQQDYESFQIMRQSQLLSWREEMRQSYLHDLVEAKINGRNLMQEKYARMMKSTDPESYENVKKILPAISDECENLISIIVKYHIKCMEEYVSLYPNLASGNRKIYSSDDSLYNTSYETYLRGELATYSVNTLKIYKDYVEELSLNDQNLNLIITEYMVKFYGYNSIKAAEDYKKTKGENCELEN